MGGERLAEQRSLSAGKDSGLVARHAWWKILLLAALPAYFTLVAILGTKLFGLHPKPAWTVIRWPAALLCGAVTFMLGRRLFDRRAQIVIDCKGIFMRQWSDVAIPWAAIRECRIDRVSVRWPIYSRLICLYLNDPSEHAPTARRARFFGTGWNLGHGNITVPAKGLDRGIGQIWEAIEHHAPAGVRLDKSML